MPGKRGSQSLITACRELLFPSCCLGCGRHLADTRLPRFCDTCHGSLETIRPPRCDICGLPFTSGADHTCGQCLTTPPAFSRARAALVYSPPITDLIAELKFRNSLTGLSSLACLVTGSTGFAELTEPDLILPVPLHPDRLRQRGFNQSLLIARACFPRHKDRIGTAILVRNRPTPAQTRLNRKERQQNISGAFFTKQPHKVTNRKILLIDDVLTTGSTAHECARTLRSAGAQQVEVLTIARATRSPGAGADKSPPTY